VQDSTGVFLTGGNQLRLSSTIGGTVVAQAIAERHRHGSVVAGTSAGASAMSSHMVAFGASGGTPKQRMVQMAAGLGILPGVIIDQHFQQRNRLGRLLSLIAQNPSLLGLGVDEDTAGVVGPDGVMEVIGRGSITVVDGSASETDAWEIKGHKPLMISGVVLHSLPSGYRFDLRRRQRLAQPTLHAIQGGGEAASS
jgi:cyanophycinase